MKQAQRAATDAGLHETVEALRRKVEELRSRTEELETERKKLLEENRRLRREITQSRLVDDLKVSTAVPEDESGSLPAVPPTTEDLFYTLPASFTYQEYFQIADNAGMDTGEAREALRAFLNADLVKQEGSRLKKNDEVPMESDGRDSPPFSRLAA